MNEQRTWPRAAAVLACIVVAFMVGGLAACTNDSNPARPSPPSSGAGGNNGSEPLPAGAGGEVAARARTTRGKVGTGCSVKNDCADGLSCVRGICQPLSFELVPTGKECFQIDCAESADCCGELSTEIPESCRSRAAKCFELLPGCVEGECTRSSDCGGGGVCTGNCAVSSGECTGNVDCLANKCVEGQCTIDFTACDSDAECAANTCIGGTCACENPSYDPAEPVCSDEACEGLCLWACEESRCVLPKHCHDDDDCFGSTPLCVEGACVECAASVDCSFGKLCLSGRCETPCQSDSHCALFEACQAGECIYVGCRSDRECTLIPDLEALGLGAGLDRRLLRCHTDEGIGRCLVPCQTDAQCPPTEVCSGGLCEYIGCETAAECKAIVGLHDQVSSDDQPWIPAVECR